jgi:hypothetical protein
MSKPLHRHIKIPTEGFSSPPIEVIPEGRRLDPEAEEAKRIEHEANNEAD